MNENFQDKKTFAFIVVCIVLFVVSVASVCAAVGFHGKYRNAVREFNLRLEQAEIESSAYKREVLEYRRRLEECAGILTTVTETNGSIGELLSQSVDIIDRITATLFPVGKAEPGADGGGDRYDGSGCYDYRYLYNFSSAKEVEE